MSEVSLYTDGAARGNPGKGGYGAILIYGSHRKELSQGFHHTTNNRMELWAIIAGLEAMKKKNVAITIFSDSKYVIDSITKGWLDSWTKSNFKGGKIKNSDLWRKYYQLAKDFTVAMVWVKGHADNPHNNRCDQLATEAADSGDLINDHVYEGSDMF